jgi:hypothetical protein
MSAAPWRAGRKGAQGKAATGLMPPGLMTDYLSSAKSKPFAKKKPAQVAPRRPDGIQMIVPINTWSRPGA